MSMIAILLTIAASACHASDGDTINCRGQRYRLLGIDAPELHGCPKYRKCVEGDGRRSQQRMKAMLQGNLRIVPIKKDRFGRPVAQIYAGQTNLACAQLQAQAAVYKRQWDDGGRLARECRAAR